MPGRRRPSELEPWQAEPGRPWNRQLAAHLMRRAGFGGSRERIDEIVRAGMNAAVDELLQFDAEDDQALRKDLSSILGLADIDTLAGWWLYRMRFGRSPLREKLALFWHGHFATSHEKVARVPAMADQILLFLDHAGGSFSDLLHAILRDPAMLIWLDAADSDRVHPNENLARELFELFTVGFGSFTEKDVYEAARALTGYRVRHGRSHFDPSAHDAGEKVVLGRRGTLNASDVAESCLEHPATARRLVRLLLRYFVEPEPKEKIVEVLAEGLVQNGYRVNWVLDVVLRSRLFYSPPVIRSLVKSPVEFVVGMLTALSAQGNYKLLADAAGRMGQSLLRPPSVRGWLFGMGWIDAATLLERHSFIARLLAGRYGRAVDPMRLDLPKPGDSAEKKVDSLLEILVMEDLAPEVCGSLKRFAEQSSLPDMVRLATLAQAITSLPEYQLN